MELNETQDWRQFAPSELRNDASLAKVRDISHLAERFIAAERYSQQVVKPIGGKVSPEVAAAWAERNYRNLGRPDEPSGYGFGDSDFAKLAHSLGLNTTQVQGVGEWMDTYNQGQLDARDAADLHAKAQCEAQLREIWKGEGEYDRKLQAAERAIVMLGSPEILQAAEDAGLCNNPAFVQLWAKVGELTGDDMGIIPESHSVGNPHAAALGLMSDKTSPYFDRAHPAHEAAVDTVRRYFEESFPA